jgi:molecular chaperone HscB
VWLRPLLHRPLTVADPFETLGLAPTFALDVKALEARQQELNHALHPDRFAGKSASERRAALSRSMDINQAHRRLRDPATRADALFELLGEDSMTERTIADPALLGEMMEQREAVDEMRRNKDSVGLGALDTEMGARERSLVSALERPFATLLAARAAGKPASSQHAGELNEARRLVTELRYVRRLREEVGAILDEL